MRKEKGITLVALVITVIILIILAAVSIKSVINDGLIINAKAGKEKWDTGKTAEEDKLASLLAEIRAKNVESEDGKVSLPNSTGTKLMNYKVSGNTVEEQSVGDKTKNLFNYKDYIKNGITKEIEDGIQFEITNSRIEVPVSFTFKANTTYILSAECTGDACIGGKLLNDFVSYDWCSETIKNIVIVNPRDTDVTQNILCVDKNGTQASTIKFAMLEVGSTKTDYEPYGYKIPVTVRGTNLFNPNAEISATPIGYSGIVLDKTKKYSMKIKLKDGKTVPNGVMFGFAYRYSGVTSNSAMWFTSNTGNINRTFGVTPNREFENLTLAVYPSKSNWNEIVDAFDIMLVEGSYTENTMPEYEPYVESTTNIYLDEPLRKIEDKADYIDFKNQKVVRYIKEENGGLSLIENGPTEETVALPEIPTFEGATYITVDTTVVPSKIEVIYESK